MADEVPPCKTDPRAPHGFLRDESHSEGRYVCECEHWEPPAAPARDALRMPSELLLLLGDPLMGPAITRFVRDVQAALARDVPREPTEAMIDAVQNIDLLVVGWRGGLRQIWQNMYDAAIAEGKQP